MERVKEFIIENRFVFIVGILLLLLICWLHKDNHRNDGIHYDTDATVEQLEKRIESIEHRVDSVSKRIDQAEKTNTELGGRIESSTSIAKEIGSGIERVQDGLDSAIQRSGRIQNIIADIESKNK